MCPCATRSATTAGSAPTPSSATTSVAVPSRSASSRLSRCAAACRTTLASNSRAVLNSSGSTGVRAGPGQPSVSSVSSRPARSAAVRASCATAAASPDCCQDRRMQLGHRRTQQPRGLGQGLVQPVERGRIGEFAGVLQVHPRRQDVLQRAVMQVLGQGAALGFGDRHQFGEQLGAVGDQPLDRQQPGPLDPGQPDRRGTDPGDHQDPQDDRRPRFGLACWVAIASIP